MFQKLKPRTFVWGHDFFTPFMTDYKIKKVNTSSILKSKAKFTLKNLLGTIQFCLQAIYCLQSLDLLNASKPRVLIIIMML